MKRLIYLGLVLGLASCKLQEENRKNNLFYPVPSSVELISRYAPTGNYVTATYSFFYQTRDDVDLTKNGWDVLFEAREDFKEDFFNTEMVVGDLGLIADLGEKSCADIKNTYEEHGEYPGVGHGGYPYKEDRKLDPEFWFNYSEVGDAFRNSKNAKIDVKTNHCYALQKVTREYHIETVFHVKEHIKNKSVVIDEIEVIYKK